MLGIRQLRRYAVVKSINSGSAASLPHRLVFDDVGHLTLPLGDPDVAIFILLSVATVDHVAEDGGGYLVLSGLLLPLGELSPESFDFLLLALELEANDISLIVLTTDVSLASASLGAWLQEMGAGTLMG